MDYHCRAFNFNRANHLLARRWRIVDPSVILRKELQISQIVSIHKLFNSTTTATAEDYIGIIHYNFSAIFLIISHL